jgi:putative nucleotidyltransferase with HDIG domain
MDLALISRWWTRLWARRHRLRWTPQSLHIYRLLLAGVVIGLLAYLSPSQRPYNITVLRVGSIAQERINAPFLFYVRKSEERLEKERQDAERTVPTVLRQAPQVQEQQLARLDSSLALLLADLRLQMPEAARQRRLQRELPQLIGALSTASERALGEFCAGATPAQLEEFKTSCRRLLAELYTTGIVSSKAEILNGFNPQVRVGERELSIDAIYSQESLEKGDLIPLIESAGVLAGPEALTAVHELLSFFIEPNLILDASETRRLRAEARRSVARIQRPYLQNEMIVDKNAKVEQDHVDALNALAEKLAEQELADPATRLLQLAAALVISAFLVLVFGYYLSILETEIYQKPGHLLLLAIIGGATIAVASYIKANELHTYLVPTPLAAMLATILLSPQVGLVLSALLALFVGNIFGDFSVALICGLTSAVAVYTVRHVRHRNQFYRAMIFLPLSYALLIAAADLSRFMALEEVYQHVLPGIFTGVAAPILTTGLLPIFESLFHITTDITLLELSDLNRPLLRELAIRAPGTYTHSLIMANLSEAAAEAIGANPLLARVGCYYHDIGKMLKPEYFTENQGLRGGRNPHDHLTPTMSMLIITAHVKDGLELAEEHGLPRSIADLIPQHHGTTVIEYFYNRAIEMGVENIRRDDFRYDGPKPQTREAGVLMLADSVESAARTLVERTPNRARQLVRSIIQQKYSAGELDECGLTMRDLHKIEESFIPVLMGTLHSRVDYPWQRHEKKARKELGNPLQPRNT